MTNAGAQKTVDASLPNPQDLAFRQKLVFENLLYITPHEVEAALSLKFEFPNYVDMDECKIRIKLWEEKLKSRVEKIGLHSKEAWQISKRLSTLYLIASNIQLHKNHFENFMFFYTKGMKMMEPPARDSKWDEKPDWRILRVLAGSFSSLYYSKNGDLDTALSSITSLDETLQSLESVENFQFLLSKLYSAVGLLSYHRQDYHKAEVHLQRAVALKKQYLNKEIGKLEKETVIRDMKKKNKDREILLIYVYFIYKIAKINKIQKKHDQALTYLTMADAQLKLLSKKFGCYVGQLDYYKKKFEKFQQKLSNDIKQEATDDLKLLIKKNPKIDNNIRNVGASLLANITVPLFSRPAFESSKPSVDFGNLTELESLSRRVQTEPSSRPQTSKREVISQEKILFRIREAKGRESSPRTKKVFKTSASGIRIPETNSKANLTVCIRPKTPNEDKNSFLKNLKSKHDLLMKDAYRISVAKKEKKGITGSQFALVKNKNEEIPKIYEMTRRPNSAASGIATRVFKKERLERHTEQLESLSSIGQDNSDVEYLPIDNIINEDSLLDDIWGKVEKNKMEQNYVRNFDYLVKEDPKTAIEIIRMGKKETMVSPKNQNSVSSQPSKESTTKRNIQHFSKKLTSKLVNEIVDDLEYDVDKEEFLNKKKKLFTEQAQKILAENAISKTSQAIGESGVRKLDLSLIREARSEINEVPSLRKRLIESAQRFIPFNPYEEDGYNKTLDLVAGYDLIELDAEEIIEEDHNDSQMPSSNRENKSLPLSNEGDGRDGLEALAQSSLKMEFEMKLKADVIKKMMTTKFEQTIIKVQRIFREKSARKNEQRMLVIESAKLKKKKEKTVLDRLNTSRKFSVLVHPDVNIMSKMVTLRKSVSFIGDTTLINIKSKRRPILILEKDVDLRKLRRLAIETNQVTKAEQAPADLHSLNNIDKPQAIQNFTFSSQHQRNISASSLQNDSCNGESPGEKNENIGVISETTSQFDSMMELKHPVEKEDPEGDISKKVANQKIYRRRSSVMNSGVLVSPDEEAKKKNKAASNFASKKKDNFVSKLVYTTKMKTKAEKVKKSFQKEFQVELGNKRLSSFKFRLFFEGNFETAHIGFFKLREETAKEVLIYGYSAKIFIMRISISHITYFLDIPLLDYKSDILDKSYDTVWPVVLKALKVWMKNNRYVHADDEILPEDNYFKEQSSNMEKHYEYSEVSGASQRCSFIADKGAIRARFPDMISIGETKLFLENLLLNYMHTSKRANGKTLKLLRDSDIKDVFILKSCTLLIGLNKIKREYYQQLICAQKDDEFHTKYLHNQWMKSRDFYKNELKEIQNFFLIKKNIVLVFIKRDHIARKRFFYGSISFNVNENKPWKETPDEKDFILKIFFNGAQEEKTMSRLEFEHRFLDHKGEIDEMIKQIIYQGDVSKNLKKKIIRGLNKHVFMKNFRVVLRNINKIGKTPIDDEIFKQATTTANKNNSIGIGKIRKNVQSGMEMENLFEKNFESIYEKDFKNKREENFDFIQSSGEEDSFLEEIEGAKKVRPLGKAEVTLDDDHLFYEMERKQREKAALSRKDREKNLEDFIDYYKIGDESIKKFYARVKMRGSNDSLFMKISVSRRSFLMGSLRIDIYRPFQRHIIYYNVHDSHMSLLIMKILSIKSAHIKKKSMSHIIHQRGKLPGKSYETLIFKDKDVHLDKKEVILNNETSVKTHLIKLSEEIADKFLNKKYHFLQKLPKIGEALVTMHIFIEKLELEVEDYSFMVCFQIYPRKRKTKMFKLIVNIGDIKKFFFPFDIKSNVTAEKLLRYMKSILTQMNFVRQTLYYLPSFVPIFQRRVHKIMADDIVPLMQPLCFPSFTYTPFYLTPELLNRKESIRKEVAIVPKGKPEDDRIEELPNIKKLSAPNKLKFKVEVLRWFKNYFVKHELGKTKANISKCFLEEYVHESRVVAQFIKKAHGEYMVITVTKNLLLDHWSLKVYCPRTCRNFITHIQNKDLLNLKVKLLNKVFPIYLINEIDNPKSTLYKDYNFFSTKMSNYMDMISAKGQSIDLQEQDEASPSNHEEPSLAKIRAKSIMRNVITKQVREMIHALNVFKSDRNKKVNKIKQISMLAEIMSDGFKNSLNTPRYTNFYNYIEFYVWEKLLKSLRIKINPINGYSYFHASKLMIEMKEVLFTNYVKIDKLNDAYVEIFIKIGEEQKDSYKLFKIFEPIGYASTSSSNIYIRYLSINKLNLRLERINLREIINLYIADGFYKFQTNYMNSKLNLSDLQNLCHYIIYKIKSSNYANLIHDSSSSRKKPDKQANFFKRVQEVDDDVEINIPTYKEILSRRPLMLIALNYFVDDKLISINIYDVTSSQSINKEVLFSELEEYIPGFLAKIKNHMYKDMAKRVIGIMRHNLVVDASFEFMLSKNN